MIADFQVGLDHLQITSTRRVEITVHRAKTEIAFGRSSIWQPGVEAGEIGGGELVLSGKGTCPRCMDRRAMIGVGGFFGLHAAR